MLYSQCIQNIKLLKIYVIHKGNLSTMLIMYSLRKNLVLVKNLIFIFELLLRFVCLDWYSKKVGLSRIKYMNR